MKKLLLGLLVLGSFTLQAQTKKELKQRIDELNEEVSQLYKNQKDEFSIENCKGENGLEMLTVKSFDLVDIRENLKIGITNKPLIPVYIEMCDKHGRKPGYSIKRVLNLNEATVYDERTINSLIESLKFKSE